MSNYVYKSSSFPELEMFEIAILSMDLYFRKRQTEIRLSGSDNKHIRKELESLNQRREKANEIKRKLSLAIAEYKSSLAQLNSYEEERIVTLLGKIQNNKVVKTFSKENAVIHKRKIKAKKNLVKILQSHELGWIDTNYSVIKGGNDDDFAYEMNDDDRKHGGQNLSTIIERNHIEPSKVVTQIIGKSEYESIERKNPEVNVTTDISDISDYNKRVFISSYPSGGPLYVEDSELKKMKLPDDTESKDVQESQPIISQIDIILTSKDLLTSGQYKSLRITREKYYQLGLIDLEYSRVEQVLRILEKNNIFEKTTSLLKKYQVKLLTQRKEMLEKAISSRSNSNFDDAWLKHKESERVKEARVQMAYWKERLEKNPYDKEALERYEMFEQIYLNNGKLPVEEENMSSLHKR